MPDGSMAECAVECALPGVEMEMKNRETAVRLKSIPWTRVIVDALLLLGLLAVSSSVLLQR
ncbi:MAG: hypothetical protein ABSF64_11805 [Bryobacteraceae bacterium]|jgi:hypothetical protein